MKLGYPGAPSHAISIPMCQNKKVTRFFLLQEKSLNSEKKHLVGFTERFTFIGKLPNETRVPWCAQSRHFFGTHVSYEIN